MYTAIKAHHGMDYTNNAIDYISNSEKTDLSQFQDRIQNDDPMLLDEHTKNLFDYSTNPNKTVIINETGEQAQLVSGYLCDPVMVGEEFQLTMDKYYRHHKEHLGLQTAKRVLRAKLDENGNPVLDTDGNMIHDDDAPVYHDPVTGKCIMQEYQVQTQARTSYGWVVSCPPKSVIGYEIDPRIVHQIGLEFCERMFDGQFQAMVATHCDRAHIHNHITSCAYDITGSYKYRDTMDNLLRARHIADDLSLKFGIPISAEVAKEKGKHIDWSEWQSKQQGDSWKEQMRQDIAATARVAGSYEEFVKMMKDSGYGIRETEHHLTYTMPGETEYRCRDTRLGQDFTKDELKAYYDNNMSKEKEKNRERTEIQAPDNAVPRATRISIRVSRYTAKGRRRSDLEMVFLIAIKIIRAVRDMFRNLSMAKEHPENPIHRDFGWKERQMMDSLKLVQTLGLESKEDLENLAAEVGQRLSIAKKEEKELKQDIGYAEKLIELIDEAREGRTITDSLGFDDDLYLYDVDKKTVQANVAKEAPATPAQRRNLYILLQNTNGMYRTSVRYDEMSAFDAEAVIKFLQGKTTECPDILLSGDKMEEKALNDKYDRILTSRQSKEKEKYSEPASEAQKKRVVEILSGEDLTADNDRLLEFENLQIDTDSLTKYDAMQLINYFSGRSDLMTPLIGELEKGKIEEFLERDGKGLTDICKPLEAITTAEAREFFEYMRLIPDRRKYVKPPRLLKPYEAPTKSNLDQLKELIRIRDAKIEVPLDKLTKDDVYELTSFLLKRNAVPECLKSQMPDRNKLKDKVFEQAIAGFTSEEQQSLAHYRDVMQQLKGFGIEPQDYAQAYARAKDIKEGLQTTMRELDELKTRYKNIQRLKYNYGLATSAKFTYGSEYGEPDKNTVSIQEEKEQAVRDEEDNRIEKEEHQDRYTVTDSRAFAFPDRFFDATHTL